MATSSLSKWRLAAILLFLAGIAAIKIFRGGGEWILPTPDHVAQAPAVRGAEAVERAFAEHRSNLRVILTARVERLLPDDRKGTAHQRFLIRLPNHTTVLVAHNLELAPRVPIIEGETVEISGEYEWNDKGGVLHWTHHDPKGRHAGGYIRYRGQDYR